MIVPKWVQDLVICVALEEGCELLPEVVWRRGGSEYSSGQAWTQRTSRSEYPEGRVVVTAGRSRKDQKLVLLHELAHWLLPYSEQHGSNFWDKAWELYRRYGVPVLYAKGREGSYRKGALVAYRRNVDSRKGEVHG